MRVKRKENVFDAKASFGTFMKKKYGVGKLIIHECNEDILGGFFNGMFK